jgi:hypothetical protein
MVETDAEFYAHSKNLGQQDAKELLTKTVTNIKVEKCSFSQL